MAGYFNDRSMIRRVQREHVCALAGPRALLPPLPGRLRYRLVASAS